MFSDINVKIFTVKAIVFSSVHEFIFWAVTIFILFMKM